MKVLKIYHSAVDGIVKESIFQLKREVTINDFEDCIHKGFFYNSPGFDEKICSAEELKESIEQMNWEYNQ